MQVVPRRLFGNIADKKTKTQYMALLPLLLPLLLPPPPPLLLYKFLVAESAWVRRLAEVDPLPAKNRPKSGLSRELKTIFAPPVWGRAIHRTRTNLKV